MGFRAVSPLDHHNASPKHHVGLAVCHFLAASTVRLAHPLPPLQHRVKKLRTQFP